MKEQENQLSQQEEKETAEVYGEKVCSNIQIPSNLTDQQSIIFYKCCINYLEKVDLNNEGYLSRKQDLIMDQNSRSHLLNKIISDSFLSVRWDPEISDTEESLDNLKSYVAATYRACADVPIILSTSDSLFTIITKDLTAAVGQEETSQIIGDIQKFIEE